MSQLVLRINKKQTNPVGNNYFSYEGKFNYFVEVDINEQISETTSEIFIQIYSQSNKKYTLSCNLNWFIEKDNFQSKLNFNDRKFHVTALQQDSKVVCKITPAEQGYFGECRIFYGPIKLNNKLFNEYQSIKEQDFIELDVQGLSLSSMTNFATIEIRNNYILTHDANFQAVNDLKITPDLYINDNCDSPLQIKLCSKKNNIDILEIKTKNKHDRDLFLLLLKDKLQSNKNNSQNFGKQCEKQLTTQIQDVSMVQHNIQNNHSVSSLRSINKMFKGRNPLQVRVNDSNRSQRSLSYQVFGNQNSKRNISQTNNMQNQFSVEQDQIVNRYLTNKTFQQNQDKGQQSFGKISFKDNNQNNEQSKMQPFNKSVQQQNYFETNKDFDNKFDQHMQFQKEVNYNRDISKERIANVKLNDQNKNLQQKNDDFLKTIQRLQITNQGLKRELDFVKLQNQKNEEQESMIKNQQETLMRKQYQTLNEKFKQEKQKVLELETKFEEVQKRLLNTQNSLMDTENQKYLVQNQFREFKDSNQDLWEKAQILEKENNVLKDDLKELQQMKEQKQKVDSELQDKIELVQNLQQTIKDLNNQNIFSKEEQKDLILDLTNKDRKILKLQEKIQNLQENENYQKKEKQNLIQQLQDYKLEQQELKQEINELINFNDYEQKYNLQKKLNEINTRKLEESQNDLLELEQKYQLLKIERDQIQDQLEEFQLTNLQNKNGQQDYYKMFQSIKAKNNNLQRDYDMIKQEKEIIEQDLEEKRQDIKNYKAIQLENEEMIENLNRNFNLQKQNEIQQNQEFERKQIMSLQQNKDNGQDQMFINLQDNMSKLREDIFYLREEKFENLEKIQQLQQNINKREEDISKLSQQLNLKKIEIQNFQCKIDQQDLELSKLQQRLIQKEQQNQTLQGHDIKIEMEEILQQKEKQISYLKQKNKQFEQKLKVKVKDSKILEKLKMKDSQINSMQLELNKKTQKIDNLLLILKNNQGSQNSLQNSQIIKKIQQHAQQLEDENNYLKSQLQKIDTQKKFGDSMNMLGNIELEDVKEQLLRLLELYEEDLRYEYELLDMEDIVLKLKELIFELKKTKQQLEEKEELLDETNRLLLNYNENDEKLDDNSLLDTEIYYDQIINYFIIKCKNIKWHFQQQ